MVLLGTKRLRTTAYHPQANGLVERFQLVERFHRQLKGSLKCHNPPNRWTKALPWVLLGIRSTVKEDSKSTTTEMVYGSPLRVPREFIQPHTPDSVTDPAAYAERLHSTMAKLSPAACRQTPPTPTFFPTSLKTFTHVFVRRDSVRKPLQPPYDGPFRVISRTPNDYKLEMRGKTDTISIDRLKAAHGEQHSSQSPQRENTPLLCQHNPHLFPLLQPHHLHQPHLRHRQPLNATHPLQHRHYNRTQSQELADRLDSRHNLFKITYIDTNGGVL